MRKAILHAKKGHLDGLGQLGVAPLAAGLAAAIPFIKMVMDVLKKSGLVKPGEKAALTPDGESSTQADQLLETAEAGVQLLEQEPGTEAIAVQQDNTPTEIVAEEAAISGVDGLGSIFGSVGDFFRGNPGIALALTAGGAYLLYSAMHGETHEAPGVALGSISRVPNSPKHSRPKVHKKIPVYRLK